MKVFNCSMLQLKDKFGENRIIFFGYGSWFLAINNTEFMALDKNFAYVVDNNPKLLEVYLGDICLPLFSPERLKNEANCVIVLTSPVYMYDMYLQLNAMNLADSVLCCAFPFIQMITPNYINADLLKKVTDIRKPARIPKVIHSFWFSGEKKPYEYQKCIDTWHEKLSDYEIIEWNQDNYDCHSHPFLERAIELEAWAFAADYARLDVLYRYGGIYLDMDVEVFRNFDDLLGNDAILSFSNHIMVDLAIVGAQKNNRLIKELLKSYDFLDLPMDKKGFTRFFQPALVRGVLVDAGVHMNGSLQQIDAATIFPNSFFMPQDYILFRDFKKTKNTYCVHYDNFGWSFDKDNKKEMKKRKNNILWNVIENERGGGNKP